MLLPRLLDFLVLPALMQSAAALDKEVKLGQFKPTRQGAAPKRPLRMDEPW